MKIEYLRTAQNSYMIVKEADYDFAPYELQMVLHNKIRNLVPLQIIVADGKVEYWYDVTGMKSLEQRLAVSTADGITIRQILEAICVVKTELENYLLDDRDIDYCSSMIFWNRTGDEILFCYIPGYRETGSSGVKGLVEELLQHLNHSDAEAVRMAYGIYERCGVEDPVMDDYRECLYRKDRDPAENHTIAFADEKELWSTTSMEEKNTEELSLPEAGKRHFFRKGRKKKSAFKPKELSWFSEKEQTDSMVAEPNLAQRWGETVCFSEMDLQEVWVLVYQGDGLETDLQMDQFPYLIGKRSGGADGILIAQTVSRMHARIFEESGDLFLEDFNSTNGTYLNGHLLAMNTPTRLKKGDHLIFATEEFELQRSLVPNLSK